MGGRKLGCSTHLSNSKTGEAGKKIWWEGGSLQYISIKLEDKRGWQKDIVGRRKLEVHISQTERREKLAIG